MFGQNNTRYMVGGKHTDGHDVYRSWACLPNFLWWLNNEYPENFNRLTAYFIDKKNKFPIGEYATGTKRNSWIRFKESVIKNALELDDDERRNRGTMATTAMATE